MESNLKFFLVTFLFMCLIVNGYAVEEVKGEETTDLPHQLETDVEKEKEMAEEDVKEKIKQLGEEIKEGMEEDATFKEIMEKDLKDAITEATDINENLEETEEQEKKPFEESSTNEKTKESIEEPVTSSGEPKSDESTSGLKYTPSEEKPETTSAASMLVTDTNIEKEEAPKDTFAVWSSKGKICLLAKFHAVFSIIYSSKGGEQKAEITVPKNGYSKGKCGSSTKSPLLQVSWQKYAFTMMFNKTEEENWVVTSMELTYDTSEPLFDGATNDFCSLLNFSI